MSKKKYSVVAGRGGSRLVKFMTEEFPAIFGLLCISLCILVWISILTV